MKKRITSLKLFESNCYGCTQDDIPYDRYLCNISKHSNDKIYYMSLTQLKFQFSNKLIKHCNKNCKKIIVHHYFF